MKTMKIFKTALAVGAAGFALLALPWGLSAQQEAPSAGPERRAAPPPVDWLEACTVPLGMGEAEAWCGTYEVWENRETRRGRRIGLNVVVLPALEGPRADDAVAWLSGGPGGAATESIQGIGQGLTATRRTRDLLFVDQRGTGGSHPLDCPPPDEEAHLQEYFGEFLEPEKVRECLALQDADVTQYTTPIAMDDLNEVRQALGYRQLTLIGGSYGTRAGLIYLRRHPETARAALLKGVAPTNMRNPLPFAKALEKGLQGLFEACAADEACHAAYPDLEADWATVVARLAEGPVSAAVEHPETGRRETVTITRGVFADGVRHILYSVFDARRLPRMIHEAARGDFSRFAQQELEQAIGFGDMLSMGMFMTVTCSEDLRFASEEEIRRASDGTFLGDYRVRRQLAACEIWGRGEVGDDYTAPVAVDVPVLLMSGEYDTATPAEGAAWVAEHLPNSRHLIVPNESHGFANPMCEIGLLNRFIESGTADGLDASCLADTKRPPFELPDDG